MTTRPGTVFPSPRRVFHWRAGKQSIELGHRTLIMGILNCTPDSFSDGGRYLEPRQARARLHEMVAEGADLIDVGGESTRPGSLPVSAEEEWRRIEPVFAEARRAAIEVSLSVDTQKAWVAERALAMGASIVNDVSALRNDPGMADVVGSYGAGVVLMHMLGTPATMQSDPRYDDVVEEVFEFLRERAAFAVSAGIAPEQIVLDPGIGFGKGLEHNLELLRSLPAAHVLEYPILVGASRKRFLGALTGLAAPERAQPSVAAHVYAALAGAHIVRVHDVLATARAIAIVDAISGGRSRGESVVSPKIREG